MKVTGRDLQERSVAPLSKKRPARGRDPITLANEAFWHAEFDIAEIYLDIAEPSTSAERGRAAFVRARVARARGDLDLWFDNAQIARKDHPVAANRIVATALAGGASRRRGNADAADRLFAIVRADLGPAARAEHAYAAYLLAIDGWERREIDEAVEIIAPYLALPAPNVNLLGLMGWIAVKRERFREAGKHFAAAISSPDSGEFGGVFVHANNVQAALTMAIETADLRLARQARRIYDEIVWTDSIKLYRWMAQFSLHMIAKLEGDLDAAWLLARDAIGLAPTLPFEIVSESVSAGASRLCGDLGACRRQLEMSWTMIREHRWGDAVEEERVALSGFAWEAALEMPSEARKALTMYLSLRAKRAPHLSLDDDGRVAAFTAMTFGRIEEAMGNRPGATARYRESLAIYERLGLNLRVGMVASELYRLTREDALRERIAVAMKGAPKSWLRPVRTPADELGPKAREILSRLLVGESAKMIANDLGKSTFTVSNHTRRIFEVFEVHSRDDLRERCSELGVTPASLQR